MVSADRKAQPNTNRVCAIFLRQRVICFWNINCFVEAFVPIFFFFKCMEYNGILDNRLRARLLIVAG